MGHFTVMYLQPDRTSLVASLFELPSGCCALHLAGSLRGLAAREYAHASDDEPLLENPATCLIALKLQIAIYLPRSGASVAPITLLIYCTVTSSETSSPGIFHGPTQMSDIHVLHHFPS